MQPIWKSNEWFSACFPENQVKISISGLYFFTFEVLKEIFWTPDYIYTYFSIEIVYTV